MLIMTCLISSWILLLGKRIANRYQLNENPASPLRWWAGSLAVVLAIGFTLTSLVTFPDDKLAALNYHIVCIDMLLLPLGAIVMVLLVAPQRITWVRFLSNIIPFIVLCPLCWVVNQQWFSYAIALLMTGFMIAMMIYIMVVGTHYERELREEYSSLQGRSTKWLINVLIFMVLVLLDFTLFSMNRSVWDKLFYVLLNLFVWNIVFSRIYTTVLQRETSHTQPLDETEQETEDNVPEKEKTLLVSEDTVLFTKRLNELCKKDKVYSQDDLTRDDLARLMGMSHTTFSKLLKVTTGLNFYEYINSLRIEKATELIQAGKMDVWSIGQEVGYRYRSTFYRAFAAKHGCTPAEYAERK